MSKKGEIAIEQIITAFLVILVLFVVALVILNQDTRESIVRIAGEVFGSESAAKEDAITNTLSSQKSIINNLFTCSNSGNYNPNSKDNCFCFTTSFGIIANEAFIRFQNKDNQLISTAVSSTEAPLAQSTDNYNLGLMAMNKDTNELTCIFPSEFSIKGLDEGENDFNNLYLVWNDKRANKNPFAEGDDYTFKFYREGNEAGHPELKIASILYRVDSTHYCLITDLIELPISISSSDNPKVIDLMFTTEVSTETSETKTNVNCCRPKDDSSDGDDWNWQFEYSPYYFGGKSCLSVHPAEDCIEEGLLTPNYYYTNLGQCDLVGNNYECSVLGEISRNYRLYPWDTSVTFAMVESFLLDESNYCNKL